MTRLALTAALCAVLSTAGCAPAQVTLKDRLQNTAAATSLDNPVLKPWHLRVSFQLFDQYGRAGETGSFEEWWVGPDKYRRVFSSPSYTAIDGHSPEGAFRTQGATDVPRLLEAIAGQFLHPTPLPQEIDAAVLRERALKIGKVSMDCIMLGQHMNAAKDKDIPIGVFPTFCMDQGKDDLRMISQFGRESVIRNDLGPFQGHLVPRNILLSVDSEPAIKAHLEELRVLVPAENGLAEVAAGQPVVHVREEPLDVSMKELGKLSIVPEPPRPNAKPKKATHGNVGDIKVSIVVGDDGHVRSVKVLSADNVDATVMAMRAAFDMVFKPYEVNGVPTKVRSEVSISVDQETY